MSQTATNPHFGVLQITFNLLASVPKTGPEVDQTDGHRRRLRCLWLRHCFVIKSLITILQRSLTCQAQPTSIKTYFVS